MTVIQPKASIGSITEFRSRIQRLITSDKGSLQRRDLVILAIDGVGFDNGAARWKQAVVEPLNSVFPTTSPTAWLTSLTGADVADHGVPGVVFRVPEISSRPFHVMTYRGELPGFYASTVFDDAAAAGLLPIAIMGDLTQFDCTWRDMLLHGAQRVEGIKFFSRFKRTEHPSPSNVAAVIRDTILELLVGKKARTPRLVWCFVDLDHYIHFNGYNDLVLAFLESLDKIAAEIKSTTDAMVIAHSDHGLVPTRNSSEITRVFSDLDARGIACGGAGRTRWFYEQGDAALRLRDELRRRLPSTVEVAAADQLFPKTSLSRSRVGDVVLIAQGKDFITPSDYLFEHGSTIDLECVVPLAIW